MSCCTWTTFTSFGTEPYWRFAGRFL